MKSSTVNISFNDELLEQIDQVAREESRSRSELIREAARTYIDRKRRWKHIFALAEQKAEESSLTEEHVEDEIAEHRKENRQNKERERCLAGDNENEDDGCEIDVS